MGSKRFKNFICVYCNERLATTKDHVFAREFFIIDRRSNLPIVPACEVCNVLKSRLEHYLTTVFPFGGKHQDATDNLLLNVPGRLARNQRLARQIKNESKTLPAMPDTDQTTMAIPLDAESVYSLFAMIGRALAWHHWKWRLPPIHLSKAIVLTQAGQDLFANLWRDFTVTSVFTELGCATVKYSGMRAPEEFGFTLWRIKFYGGIVFGGDASNAEDRSSEIGVVTGSEKFVNAVTRQKADNDCTT